jgi:hypothetical protein
MGEANADLDYFYVILHTIVTYFLWKMRIFLTFLNYNNNF